MKILYKTMGLGLLSACLYLLCAAPASAKVCFVGEENCTGGGSFEDYENPDFLLFSINNHFVHAIYTEQLVFLIICEVLF